MKPAPRWRQGQASPRWPNQIVLASMFILVAGISLAAPLIANSRPLIVIFKGHIYLPVFQNLAGDTFGDQFLPTLADYSNPETTAAILANGKIIWPLIPYRDNSMVWAVSSAPSPPSIQNWLGTDATSRDVLAQTLFGVRLSCLFGFAVTAAAAALGMLAGAIQGYYGGLTDLLLQRATEIWSGIPQFFLIIILASIIRPNLCSLFTFILIFSWMGLAARVRAECLRARSADYIGAAKALGVPNLQIIRRHILPNAAVAVITFLPFLLAESIILLTGLDFLGFGPTPKGSSLGQLLLQAKNNPQAPWLGLTVFITLGGILTLLISIGSSQRAPLTNHQSH